MTIVSILTLLAGKIEVFLLSNVRIQSIYLIYIPVIGVCMYRLRGKNKNKTNAISYDVSVLIPSLLKQATAIKKAYIF